MDLWIERIFLLHGVLFKNWRYITTNCNLLKKTNIFSYLLCTKTQVTLPIKLCHIINVLLFKKAIIKKKNN